MISFSLSRASIPVPALLIGGILGITLAASSEEIDSTNWRYVYMNAPYAQGGQSESQGVYAVHANRQENTLYYFDVSAFYGSTARGDATITFQLSNPSPGAGVYGASDYLLELIALNQYNTNVNLDDATTFKRNAGSNLSWIKNDGTPLPGLNYDDAVLDIGTVIATTGPVPGDTANTDATPGATFTFTIPQATLQSWFNQTRPPVVVITANRTSGGGIGGLAFSEGGRVPYLSFQGSQPPSGTDKSVMGTGGSYSFTPSDFGFTDSDVPPHDFESVVITTIPGNGALSVGGVPVTAGQEIAMFSGPAGATWTASPHFTNLNGATAKLSHDGQVAVFGAWAGPVYVTSNGGTSWTSSLAGVTANGIALSSNGSKIYLAPREVAIQISNDGGATWTAASGAGTWFYDVACSSDGTKAVACQGTSTVVVTSDGGSTWATRSVPGATSIGFVDCSSDGTKMVVAEFNGRIHTSTDSGVNWTARAFIANWTGVTSSADGTKLAATVSGGNIHTSTDSGVNWTAREQSSSWHRIDSSSDGNVLVTQNDEFLYTSTNAGVSWTQRLQVPNTPNAFWRNAAISGDGSRMLAPIGGLSNAHGLYSSEGSAVLPVWNGTASTSFTFQVRDSGPAAGGANLDPTPNTMTIIASNLDPTDILLTSGSIAENQPANAVVGNLSATDPDAGQSHGFSLVSGEGDGDNGAFNVLGASLRLTASADFETKPGYSIRLRASDGAGGTFEKAFTISVTDVNEAPVDISLSQAAIPENAGVNATVGTLSAVGDPDAGATHTFSLVVGSGDTDNASFNLSGASLRLAASADFESKAGYTVRVRADDGNGGTFEKAFAISVTNVNEAPAGLTLSDATVDENAGGNAIVGAFTTLGDPDAGATHTYTLVPGVDDDDNAAFNINGGDLRLTASANFEVKSSYKVRVRTDDGLGGFFENAFTITVNNINESPTDLTLGNSSLPENGGANAVVGTLVALGDPDAGATHIFTLAVGTGDTDNAAFNISGTTLRLGASADFETKSSYSVRLLADDGLGGTFAKSFTISITNVNESPTDISLSNTSVPENAGADFVVGALTALGDPDAGAAHTFALVGGTGSTDNGAFTLAGNSLRLSTSADFETKASYSVRVAADDGLGGTFAKAFTITIGNVNEPPTDFSLSNTTVPENSGANAEVGTLTATGDPDAGASHTFTLVAGTGSTDNASFNISGQSLRLNAGADFESKSSYSVRIEANDGLGGSYAKAVTIVVTDVNESPTDISLSHNSINENAGPNATVGTLVASGDPDAGATHTFSLVAGSGGEDNASFSISGGTLRLTASANFEAKSLYTARIRADDGAGGVLEKSFSITVEDVNEPPLDISLDGNSLPENAGSNAAVGIFSALGDPDAGATHTFTLAAGAGDTDNAAFNISGATLRLTGSADFETKSEYGVRILADDGNGGSVARSFLIFITDVNEAPSITAIPDQVIDEDGVASGIVFSVSDPENGNLSVAAVSGDPALLPNGSIIVSPIAGVPGQRTVSATPSADRNGVATISLTVTDPGGLTSSTTFDLVVNAMNDAPVAVPQIVSTDEDAANAITLAGSDVENSELTFVIVSAPTHGVLSGTGPSRTYTPEANYHGTDSFTFKVDDGDAESAEATVSITVNPVNDAPTATPQSMTIDEDTAKPITLAGMDVEGSSLEFAVVGGPSHGILSGSGASRIYTPDADFHGTDSFTFTVNDGSIESAAATVSITVAPVNDAPTDVDLSASTLAENGPANAIVGTLTTVGDPDIGDSHTYSLVPGEGSDDNAAFHIAGNVLRIHQAGDFESQAAYLVRIQTQDTAGAAVAKSFTINVTDVNEAPAITALGDLSIDEDGGTGPMAFTVSDPEGSVLSVSAATGNPALVPLGGIAISPVSAAPGVRSITVTPQADANGTAAITLTVTDAGGLTASTLFTLTVNPVNDAPSISDLADQSTSLGSATGPIPFTIGDLETVAGDLVVSATSNNGTLLPPGGITLAGSGTDRTLSLTPAPGVAGTATLTVTVSDGILTASDTFLLTVTNGAPNISVIAPQSIEEDTGTGPIAFTVGDSETPAADLTVSAVSDNAELLPSTGILLGGTGSSRTVAVSPAAHAHGTAVVTLTVSDGLLTASRSFTVTVSAVNDAPTITDIGDQMTDEDTATGAVSFTIGDLETGANALVVTAASGNESLLPASGIVFGGSGSSRTVTLLPSANQHGSANVTLTVSDGELTASDTFVLIVSPVNDAPVLAVNLASVTVDEGAAAANSGTFGDLENIDGVTLVANVGTVTKNAVNGTWEWSHQPAEGPSSETVTITASDDGSPQRTATATFSLAVTNVSPSFAPGPDAQLPPPSGSFTRSVPFIDPGADVWSGTVDYGDGTPPSPLDVNQGAKTFSLGHTYQSSGTFTVTVTLADDDGGSAVRTFGVTTVLNLAPTAISLGNESLPENSAPGSVVGMLSATDPDAGQSHVFQLASGDGDVDNGAFTITGNILSMNMGADFESKNAYSIRVRATDNGSPSFSVEEVFAIQITNVNEAPVASGLDLSTNEDIALPFTLPAVDPDAGTTLTYEIVTGPGHGVLSGLGASRTYTPAANYFGPDQLVFRVRDGELSSGEATVSFTVQPVNDEPTLAPIDSLTTEATGPAGAPVTFTITGIDVEDGVLTGSGNPVSGSGFPLGTTSVTATVTDSGGLSASTVFNVIVRDTTAPSVTPPADVSVPATSPTGAVVNFGAASASDVVTANPSITYSKASGTTFPIGETSVTVTATDAAGNEGSATFTVIVGPGMPVLGTPAATNITRQAAQISVPVVFDGGFGFDDRGFLFANADLNPDPMPGGAGVTVVVASPTGPFATGITYDPGARIAVRAYGVAPGGTVLSPVTSFLPPPDAPTVGITGASDITDSSAVVSATVIQDGGAEVTERGVVYSVSSDPKLGAPGSASEPMGAGTGAYAGTLAGLAHTTEYFARAYATNVAGTAYSPTIRFKTLVPPPTVAPLTLSDPLATTIDVSTTVTGISTESGFVYGPGYPAPTLESGIRVVSTAATGPISRRITGLKPESTYTVRAYAIASGTGNVVYSPIRTFTTRTPTDLFVRTNMASKTYGEDNPEIPIIIEGLQPGHADLLTFTIETSAEKWSPIGSYPIAIKPSDPHNLLGNYHLFVGSGTLEIVRAPASVFAASGVYRVDPSKASLIPLRASAYSGSDPARSGEIAFRLSNWSATVGSEVVGRVEDGVAVVDYAVPAGTPEGTYLISHEFTDPNYERATGLVSIELVHGVGLLQIIGLPATVEAGNPASFSVAVMTPNGTLDTSYAGHVQFSCSDPRALLPSTTPLQGGRGVFTVTPRQAGTTRIEVVDPASGERASKMITVTPKDPGEYLMSFGEDVVGQLGFGSTASFRPNPVTVRGANFSPLSFSSGLNHSLAIDLSGALYAWGSNDGGQLGIPSLMGSTTPQRVTGVGDKLSQVAAGNRFSLALTGDRTVSAWGSNLVGQLGDGTTLYRRTPVYVKGINDVVSIAAGLTGGAAVKSDGTLWTWGIWPTIPSSRVPVQVPGVTGIKSVQAGHGHLLLIDQSGGVRTLGLNQKGQLGIGNTVSSGSVVNVNPVFGIPPRDTSAGGLHNLLLDSGGNVWGWGENMSFQLNGGNQQPAYVLPLRAASRELQGGFNTPLRLAASNRGSAVTIRDGSILWWGGNRGPNSVSIRNPEMYRKIASGSTAGHWLLSASKPPARVHLTSDLTAVQPGRLVKFQFEYRDSLGNSMAGERPYAIFSTDVNALLGGRRLPLRSIGEKGEFSLVFQTPGIQRVRVQDDRMPGLFAEVVVEVGSPTSITLAPANDFDRDGLVPVMAVVTMPNKVSSTGIVIFEVLDGNRIIAGTGLRLNNGVAAGFLRILPGVFPPTKTSLTLTARYSPIASSGILSSSTEGLILLSPGAGAAGDTVLAPGGASPDFEEPEVLFTQPVSVTYRTEPREIPLSGMVEGSGGTVYVSVLDGAEQPIGGGVVVPVSPDGTYTTVYSLPGRTPVGRYVIRRDFLGTETADPAVSESALNVEAASVSLSGEEIETAFSYGEQLLQVLVGLDSSAGLVEEGVVSIEIRDTADGMVGSAAEGIVAEGVARVDYTLPAGLEPGRYRIRASYDSGTPNLSDALDDTRTLVVRRTALPTTIDVPATTSPLRPAAFDAEFTANILSPDTVVDGGEVTLQLHDGLESLGEPVTTTVIAGIARANLTVPAGSDPGRYLVIVNYLGTADFLPSKSQGTFDIVDPADLGLSELNLVGAKLDVDFDKNLLHYTATVASEVSEISVIPVTLNPVSIRVNGSPVLSGYASDPIPVAGAETLVEVEVESQDGQDSRTYSVNVVRDANDAPTGILLDNGGGRTSATLTADDPDPGQSHVFELVSGAGDADNAAFVIDGSTISLTLEAIVELKSLYHLRVRVTDNGNPALSHEQALTMEIVDENDPPVITSYAGTSEVEIRVPENSNSVTTVSAQDEDLPFQLLSFSVSGPDAASFSVGAGGNLFFNAPPDFESPGDVDGDNLYDVTVTVTDNGQPALEAGQSYLIEVTDENEAPTATDVTAVGDEDDPDGVDVTLSAEDPDEDRIIFRIVSSPDPAEGTLGLLEGNIVTFFPAPDFHGTSDFTYVAGDGTLDSQVATATVTVNPVNDPPTMDDISDLSTLEDTATDVIAFSIADLDETDVLAVQVRSDNPVLLPAEGILLGGSGSDRTLTLTPAADRNGTATVTVEVGDGTEVIEDTFVLTVTPVNDPPSFELDDQTGVDPDPASDGRLWAWGLNTDGQLGGGPIESADRPRQIGTHANWQRVIAGDHFTLALKGDGSLWAWGRNQYGQLGIGTTIGVDHPIQVERDRDWLDASAGDGHVVALKEDGSLWAWGRNDQGQLGDGTLAPQTSPRRIGEDSDWRSVSAGGLHTLAIKNDGSLWAWGGNSFRQLGTGAGGTVSTPTRVGTDSDWASISAGGNHSLALKSDGTLWAWGRNDDGQLGDGSAIQCDLPKAIGSDSDWSLIAAGSSHSAALKSDGTLWTWGRNAEGQLGDGTRSTSLVPQQVGEDTDWWRLALGRNHGLALKNDGSLWAWGDNTSFQLGSGTTDDLLVVTRIGSDTWSAIAAGLDHSVAVEPEAVRLTIPANSGPFTLPGFAADILAGPFDEGTTQSVGFEVSVDDSGLLAAPPVIDSEGTLTLTPGTDAGTFTVTVVAKDDGGTANGGIDTSEAQTFAVVITVAPEIEVTGNSIGIRNGAATSDPSDHTDFGETPTVGGSVTRTFTIHNPATAPLILGELAVTGSEAFSLTSLPEGNVVERLGGTRTFSISFDPTTPGLHTARVGIVSDDEDENPFTFIISGTGITPEISITGNSTGIADGDTTPSLMDHTDFGGTEVSGGSVSRTFLIRNTGTQDLTLEGEPVVSVSGSTAFSIASMPPTNSVPKGNGESPFVVVFDPEARGVHTAVVTIANNDEDEARYSFTIRGAGLAPEIAVYGNGVHISNGDGIASAGDHTLFGSSGTAMTRSFTIVNEGDAMMNLGSPAVSVSGSASFSVQSQPAASTVAANGGVISFAITFDPAAPGIQIATVSLSSDDADENPYTFAIRGNGLTQLTVGSFRTFVSGGPVNLATMVGASPAGGVFSGPGVQGGIFDPSGLEPGEYTILYTVDDAIGQTLESEITVIVELSPPSLQVGNPRAFPKTTVGGNSRPQTIAIRNVGGKDAESVRVVVSGNDRSAFRVVSKPGPTIAGGGSDSFRVIFSPRKAGNHRATAIVTSNAGPVTIKLNGSGRTRRK